ncbi:hypothetical protein DIPPA_17915 [Diplonema papillatum]|nr:hypothetical protein DIPPA_17915 [Diplonema papillatum]
MSGWGQQSQALLYQLASLPEFKNLDDGQKARAMLMAQAGISADKAVEEAKKGDDKLGQPSFGPQGLMGGLPNMAMLQHMGGMPGLGQQFYPNFAGGMMMPPLGGGINGSFQPPQTHNRQHHAQPPHMQHPHATPQQQQHLQQPLHLSTHSPMPQTGATRVPHIPQPRMPRSNNGFQPPQLSQQPQHQQQQQQPQSRPQPQQQQQQQQQQQPQPQQHQQLEQQLQQQQQQQQQQQLLQQPQLQQPPAQAAPAPQPVSQLDNNKDALEAAQWTAFVDQTSGRTYYFNTVTKEKQWEKPVGFGDGEPKCDWQSYKDPKTGKFFYHNATTGAKQWECPAEYTTYLREKEAFEKAAAEKERLRQKALEEKEEQAQREREEAKKKEAAIKEKEAKEKAEAERLQKVAELERLEEERRQENEEETRQRLRREELQRPQWKPSHGVAAAAAADRKPGTMHTAYPPARPHEAATRPQRSTLQDRYSGLTADEQAAAWENIRGRMQPASSDSPPNQSSTQQQSRPDTGFDVSTLLTSQYTKQQQQPQQQPESDTTQITAGPGDEGSKIVRELLRLDKQRADGAAPHAESSGEVSKSGEKDTEGTWNKKHGEWDQAHKFERDRTATRTARDEAWQDEKLAAQRQEQRFGTREQERRKWLESNARQAPDQTQESQKGQKQGAGRGSANDRGSSAGPATAKHADDDSWKRRDTKNAEAYDPDYDRSTYQPQPNAVFIKTKPHEEESEPQDLYPGVIVRFKRHFRPKCEAGDLGKIERLVNGYFTVSLENGTQVFECESSSLEFYRRPAGKAAATADSKPASELRHVVVKHDEGQKVMVRKRHDDVPVKEVTVKEVTVKEVTVKTTTLVKTTVQKQELKKEAVRKLDGKTESAPSVPKKETLRPVQGKGISEAAKVKVKPL